MLTLYIVRHGETEWNKEGRIQGRLNSNLTNQGRADASLLGERLKTIDFAEVITSPSGRAIETTEIIIKGRGFLYQTDERIMEMDMGLWQGLTKSEIQEGYSEVYECFMHRPDFYRNEGAETFLDIYMRAKHFLDELKNSDREGNLLIVSHGLFIKSLFLVLKGMGIPDFWSEETVDGTSLSIVKIEAGESQIVLEGDISHKLGQRQV